MRVEMMRRRAAKAARRRARKNGIGTPYWVVDQRQEAVRLEGYERWQWLTTRRRGA